MKKIFYPTGIALVLIGMFFTAFQWNNYRPHNYEPVMLKRVDFESLFEVLPAREIESPGKIWVFNNYILLVEQYQGIHVIDNSSPNSPQRTNFINIVGCTELAVRNGIIYANNAVDLIGIKGNSNFTEFELLSRNRDVLPIISSPEPWSDWYYIEQLPEDMIIINWEPITD